MATTVIASDEYLRWFGTIDQDAVEAIAHTLAMLEALGVTLRYPHSSAITGWNPLRELRIQSNGRPFRVFYGFDELRRAVLLLGQDKTGMSDERFYTTYAPGAARLWKAHVAALKAQLAQKAAEAAARSKRRGKGRRKN